MKYFYCSKCDSIFNENETAGKRKPIKIKFFGVDFDGVQYEPACPECKIFLTEIE